MSAPPNNIQPVASSIKMHELLCSTFWVVTCMQAIHIIHCKLSDRSCLNFIWDWTIGVN